MIVVEISGRVSRGVSLETSIIRDETLGGSICIDVGRLGSNGMQRVGVGRASVHLLIGELTPDTVPSRSCKE